MKHTSLNITIVGLLLPSLAVMLSPLFGWRELSQPDVTLTSHPQAAYTIAATDMAQLIGDYSGEVQLHATVAGVYSDTLAAPPNAETPDLGAIDLALNLSQSGSTVSGYVSLDKTLVFAVAHSFPNGNSTLKIGPYVNGSFDGTNLTLLSEKVDATLGGQPIQRQFQLSGAISASDGSRISGEYRETLWGATHQPVTMLGTFTLQRLVFATDGPDPNNKAPPTVADIITTMQGIAVTINVLANDSDSNGDSLTITGVSKPQFGQATTDGNSVTYAPNATFTGNDTFSYFVSDGKGGVAASSVTIIVLGQSGKIVYLPVILR
jgi:hypothetical protein